MDNIEDMENQTCGFLIPNEYMIDEPYNNWFAKLIRKTGWLIIRFGSWIRTFGYYQRKIYPYKQIAEMLNEIGKGKIRNE